ncbi:MAG: hypothetical protein LBP59_09225 [Planctomycetaceae bacterium]|nr:hypothetical protein [Planctomycetaceae bacterium]
MITTACIRDARDPSDDFLLQKSFSSFLKNYSITSKIYRLNFRERLQKS